MEISKALMPHVCSPENDPHIQVAQLYYVEMDSRTSLIQCQMRRVKVRRHVRRVPMTRDRQETNKRLVRRLAVASILLRAFPFDLDGVRVVNVSVQELAPCIRCAKGKFDAQFSLSLLDKRILCHRLEGLLNIDGFLRGCLKIRNVSLGLTPCHRPLLCDLS